MNGAEFVECGEARRVTVDDAHGSPSQKCPRTISGYCRYRNLRFIDPCWCLHGSVPTEKATFTVETLDLGCAKFDEIVSGFMTSAPFHNGRPRVTDVRAIKNPTLEAQHEQFRRYLATKNGSDPKQVDLYHGTNVNILDTVYRHGLQPPSDMEASQDCPVSGGKGLRTSLCDNSCMFCTRRHEWNQCHMFGAGIYLGDIAQKSHRYVSGVSDGAYRMVVCSVLLGEPLQIEGHLREPHGMHDVASLRVLEHGDLQRMLTSVDGNGPHPAVEKADQKDVLFVKGLQNRNKPGLSVVNSEYISFHPYQCLPLYEISYRMA